VTLRIESVRALEILDSRGQPTVRVYVVLDNGVVGTASVPSGASTGKREALELRDGDVGRYGGKGVQKAVAHVETIMGPAIRGMDPRGQAEIDQFLIDLDGSPGKGRLGANAILGVSQAVARAAARALDTPLYAYLGGTGANRLPRPMINILNGGLHSDFTLDFQEFMIVPVGADSFREALRYGAETFAALRQLLKARGYATRVGDEGGFAVPFDDNEEACAVIVEAIAAAGYEPGVDIALALDPAASAFCKDGTYHLAHNGHGVSDSRALVALYERWVGKYPILSIEDGLAEDDWQGFQDLTARLGDKVQIVGDDILVTNPELIARAIAEKAGNAALIKPNQIGTVSETIAAIQLCRKAGWAFVVSHRSGDTEDDFIADFAVAMGGGQIKTGSVCRSERVAKYNRLLEIERELGRGAQFGP
jgi:enolase